MSAQEEKQYDQIPNFTAADVKRLCGIGRNEYIEILNQCKAKKVPLPAHHLTLPTISPLNRHCPSSRTTFAS
jgi:hypothetical protein